MNSLILIFVTLVVYVLGVSFYRLFLSPIRHFPGPKLAALSFWYEGWYDVVKDGSYTWKIKEMHEKYGPAVRINPCEVHVSDPDFYHVLYAGSTRKTDKWYWSARMFGTDQAIVGTTDHHLHHMRKQSLQSFFSKTSVSKLEPLIQCKADLLCQRIRDTKKPVNASDAFTAFSADVIGSYVFGIQYGFLDRPDFAPEWRRIMTDLSRSTHLMKQLGWLYPIINSRIGLFFGRLLAYTYNPLKDLFNIRDNTRAAIKNAQEKSKDNMLGSTNNDEDDLPAVLESMFNCRESKLPPSELQHDRLLDESITLLGAGTVTTAQTLSNTVYYILASSEIQEQLRQELANLYVSSVSPTWTRLSQLPYLTAVLHEGLRLSYGVSSRLPRIAPDLDLILPDGRAIPRGTPVSMTHMFIHDDSDLFPNAHRFDPTRWLASSTNHEALIKARKYFVPFSRGTRACIGTNLAWAELYIAVAGIFRPVEYGGLELELWQTGEEEVRVAKDYFNPAPASGSVGVRVINKSLE